MQDNAENEMRKELIEDYFLEITELIGGENLRTEIEFTGPEAYSAKLILDVSKLDGEEELESFIAGLKPIIRRINVLEKDIEMRLCIELNGMHRS